MRDKTLAGKKAIFDVNVLEANTRTVPEIDDELANTIRPGLDAEGVRDELRKAIDENESADWIEARNKALSNALAEVMDVDVPDTLVTTQAREKYAQMMSEFRGQGMADDEIKKLITPENFQVYKDIEKPDIVKDFKTSMATDEIARLESIEVPAYQIDEQLEAVKKEANGEDLGDENMIRNKIESTLMRRMVFDFLAEKADLSVEYAEEEKFDEAMMEELMQQTMKDKEGEAEDGKLVDDGTAAEEEIEAKAAADAKAKEETEIAEATTAAQTHEAEVAEARQQPTSAEEEKKLQERYASMDLEERAFNILVDLGSVELTPDPESPTYDNSEDSEFVQ